MKEVDWSKAPEWATGYGLMSSSFGIEEVWFNDEQYRPLQSRGGYGPYPFGGGVGPHMHNATKGQISFQQHRPAPWMGEGLPPVGVACEVENDIEGGWDAVDEVLAHTEIKGAHVAVFKRDDRVFYSPDGTFRPIRTPEQIAAEEREKAVSQMAVIALAGDNQLVTKVYLERLYDAGWRRMDER
ncbi:hypothetical protein BAY1663_02303 [Pseudomonas sp. BAY1663]|uniref:hypothetical protein n=1 Tax=Pseudomonas sp. BAY1663 TaxID=1439940 RepID=UPI00042E0F23|nr:hypothetical protein [Pseudomonas sp. BAY1663]EXF45224.1 hypothetical protein BAY1663_02303 [Pseudomonas sp. BAY1663]